MDSILLGQTHISQYLQPKHKYLFEVLGEKVGTYGSLLDVGGASGDFVGYLKRTYPQMEATCLDSNKTLIKVGTERYPDCKFMLGDARNMRKIKSKSYDVVTMIGVMGFFDDFRKPLAECIRIARRKVYVVGLFNPYPIDCIVQWRYARESGLRGGWNIHSWQSVCDFMESEVDSMTTWRLLPFSMPEDLTLYPTSDPIRSWHVSLDGKRMFRNGLLTYDIGIMEIDIPRPNAHQEIYYQGRELKSKWLGWILAAVCLPIFALYILFVISTSQAGLDMGKRNDIHRI